MNGPTTASSYVDGLRHELLTHEAPFDTAEKSREFLACLHGRLVLFLECTTWMCRKGRPPPSSKTAEGTILWLDGLRALDRTVLKHEMVNPWNECTRSLALRQEGPNVQGVHVCHA